VSPEPSPSRVPVMSGAAVALGLLTVAWPLAWAPGWAYAVAVLGAAAVLAAAQADWRQGPVPPTPRRAWPGPARGCASRRSAVWRASSPAARCWPPWPCTR
jgi:hypothetical protein